MTWRSAPLFILMGKKSGKPVKEKIRGLFQKYLWFPFLPSETRTKHLAHAKRNLGGSDPVRTFGRQNRTNTRVAPAQIEVFVRGLFAELFFLVCSSAKICGGAQVNGTPIFSGEHCVCSCVHPVSGSANDLRYTFFMMRLILAPMVLALSPLPATAQVKIHVSPSHHKQYETIHASVENAGSKPIAFCIQVGQTSPKGGGETEATPSPFWVQKNSDGRWSTLLVGPDVGRFQHPEVLEPGKSLDFPFRLGESGQMRLRLTYWNGSRQSLVRDAPPKGAKAATSEPFAVQ